MIKISGLKKSYVSKKSVRVDALRDVDLDIGDRGLVAIVGKSGSGKSTLLNIIAGLDTPSEGRVVIDGFDMFSKKSEERDVFRLHNIGIVFQSYNLLDGFTVGENVAMGLSMSEKAESSSLVKEALNKVGLYDMEKRKVEELSGGQKQRVAIARAIVKGPNIILLDEPTGNLDSENSKNIFELIRELSKESLVLTVTHSEELAREYADSIIRIQDGKVVNDEKVYGNSDENKKTQRDHNVKSRVISPKVSFMIAMKNVKKRFGRLVVTMLLFVLVFAAIGVTLEGIGYDKASLIVDRLYEIQESEVMIEYETNRDEIRPIGSVRELNSDLIKKLKNQIGNDKVIPIYCGSNSRVSISTVNGKEMESWTDDDSRYYHSNFNCLLKGDVENKFDCIEGRLPNTDREIAVTKYVAECLKYFTKINIKNIIGSFVKISKYGENENFTIVGIVDTHLNERYKAILGNENWDLIHGRLNSMMIDNEYSVHNSIIVANKEILDNISVSITYTDINYKSAELNFFIESLLMDKGYTLEDIVAMGFNYSIVEKEERIKSSNDVLYNEELVEFFDGNKRPLEAGEAILDWRECMDYIEDNFLTSVYYEDWDNHVLKIPDKIKNDGYFNMKFYGDYNAEVKVVGYYRAGYDSSSYSYINDDAMPLKTAGIENPSCATLLIDGNNRAEDIKTVRKLLEYEVAKNSGFNLLFLGSHDVYVGGNIIALTNMLCYAVMLIFGVIGLILMIGFVDMTIRDSEREAGILRSMGAKGNEVGFIYAIEAVFVIILSLILGYVLSVVLASFSKYFYSGAVYLVSPFRVAAWHFPIMLLVAVAVSIVVSIYPLYRMKKANPADMTRYKG
ncbi:MAG: ABC transporter ATP-binding protein/permease [Clostridia bacterium]|nr:ABC transporter ATP-binding protein/permease [Clostridia bacterium]